MTRIRTWVFAATTRSTNHYTIMAKSPAAHCRSKNVCIILLADREAIDQSAYLHILQLKGFPASFLSMRGQIFDLHYNNFSTLISWANLPQVSQESQFSNNLNIITWLINIFSNYLPVCAVLFVLHQFFVAYIGHTHCPMFHGVLFDCLSAFPLKQ